MLSLIAAVLLIMLGGLWLVIQVIRNPEKAPPSQAKLPSTQEKKEPHNNTQQADIANQNKGGQREQEGQFEQRKQERPLREEETGLAQRKQNNQGRQPRSSLPQSSVQYSFLLLPGGPIREGGEGNTLKIPSNAGIVNLQLPLIGNADFRSYKATLKTTDNTTLLTQTGLQAKAAQPGEMVSVSVPARLLRQQRYRMELQGITANGELREISGYSFQVEK